MQVKNKNISVIVPTYNEKENIELLVNMLLALPVNPQVIVVDDNSPDGTGDIADRLAEENPGRIHVIHREGKLGLGTAYIAGFDHAIQAQHDLIITMDADFSHPPQNIPDMVAKIEEGYDLVIGSRYVPGGKTVECTFLRKLLSWGANSIARLLLGLRAHDASAGFRCYKREILESIDLDKIFSSGYSFLIEMLYKVQLKNWKIGEVPITFQNRQQGVSKISRREIIRALETVMRIFLNRISGKAL